MCPAHRPARRPRVSAQFRRRRCLRGTFGRIRPCILCLVRRHSLIHLALVLAVGLTNCLAVCGLDEVRRASSGVGGSASIAVGVVSSPQLLVPRLKSGGEQWAFSNSSVDRAPALALPMLRLSSAAGFAPRSV